MTSSSGHVIALDQSEASLSPKRARLTTTVILNNKTVRYMEQIRFQEHISLEIITKRRLIFKF